MLTLSQNALAEALNLHLRDDIQAFENATKSIPEGIRQIMTLARCGEIEFVNEQERWVMKHKSR